MKNGTVSVLGTEYKIILDCKEEDMPDDSDGCMDCTIHTIRLKRLIQDKNSVQEIEVYKKKLLRHEIIHAFLHESGIWDNSEVTEHWGVSEEITDWIAIQFPKMQQAFIEVDCL